MVRVQSSKQTAIPLILERRQQHTTARQGLPTYCTCGPDDVWFSTTARSATVPPARPNAGRPVLAAATAGEGIFLREPRAEQDGGIPAFRGAARRRRSSVDGPSGGCRQRGPPRAEEEEEARADRCAPPPPRRCRCRCCWRSPGCPRIRALGAERAEAAATAAVAGLVMRRGGSGIETRRRQKKKKNETTTRLETATRLYRSKAGWMHRSKPTRVFTNLEHLPRRTLGKTYPHRFRSFGPGAGVLVELGHRVIES